MKTFFYLNSSFLFLSSFLSLYFSSFLFLPIYLSPRSLLSPSQVFMLYSISIFRPLFTHVFHFIFSLFLVAFINLFYPFMSLLFLPLYFCSFLFVRPVLVPAECLLNPLCPSVCTKRTREPLLRTSQSLRCRSYLMD